MKRMNKVIFVCLWILLVSPLVKAQINLTERMRSYAISPVTSAMEVVEWIVLAKDKEGDGANAASADGKTLSYYYERASDKLWFKYELYKPIEQFPAVSVTLDIDSNQENGIPWYGSNSQFRFEKVASIGPIREEEGANRYFGWNGITNHEGVQTRSWMNDQIGGIELYISADRKTYYLSIIRSDISPEMYEFNVIGSVGMNALWNDDFGVDGDFSKVQLSDHK